MMSSPARRWYDELIRQGVLGLLCLLLLVPFYIVVVNVFKDKADILSNPLSLPIGHLTFDNLIKAAVSPSFNIFKAYGNSIVITTLSILFIVTVGAMMSYVIARSHNRFTKFVYFLLLAGLMIPPQVLLLPLVKLLDRIGLLFTFQGLIFYNIAWYLPFTVFIYTGFIRTISAQLDESAKMEGAGMVRIFWGIIFPLLRPATASVVIFLFLWIWNDFINPLVILGTSGGYTVTTGIYMAIGKFSSNWDQVFSLMFMASVPVLVLYVFMQRFIIAGLTDGAVKG
ncbi:carbohydrate ABC transporter permease [Paenibacillus filicis]|uniref:Carbohydrate ABC transporter permease n=1 Tax=Paenibacillus filicis TaxID=669464 RepID=A0ABU9DGK0_9BACL